MGYPRVAAPTLTSWSVSTPDPLGGVARATALASGVPVGQEHIHGGSEGVTNSAGPLAPSDGEGAFAGRLPGSTSRAVAEARQLLAPSSPGHVYTNDHIAWYLA